MALAKALPAQLVGSASPRIAPPVPARSLLKEYQAAAKELGIKLMPWQILAARYLFGLNEKRWQYREVAIVVARQNGKTSLLLPRILMGLQRGERMLHTAQNRAIPRETFLTVARLLNGQRGVEEIRFANGQELIRYVTEDGKEGRYTLVAPRPGVRGHSVDTVFLDEVREQRSFDLLASIKPTLTASRNPQIVYLSNAGDDTSVVLNDLRRRSETDTSLAYLEWSADPDRSLDDRLGWAEANPALGITILPETLEDFHRSLPPAVFETEHLCRWVISMQPSLVDEASWLNGRQPVEPAVRPTLGVCVDASGTRASAVIAWQQTDGHYAVRVIADVHGDPIEVGRFGKDLAQLAGKLGVSAIGYASWTDAELAKHLKGAKAIDGKEFANATLTFVRLVTGGRLHWSEADQVTDDLTWTARKPHESGAYVAAKAKEDRPITAVLAAIRAVGLATGPQLSAPRFL